MQIKSLFLFKEKSIVITVGNLQTTSTQCVSKMQSCFVSHHNTHTEALCSKDALRPRGKTVWSHCDVNRSFVIQETVIVVAEVNALSGSNSFHLHRRAVSCPFFSLHLTHAYCNLIMWNGELRVASVSRAFSSRQPSITEMARLHYSSQQTSGTATVAAYVTCTLRTEHY